LKNIRIGKTYRSWSPRFYAFDGTKNAAGQKGLFGDFLSVEVALASELYLYEMLRTHC